MKRRNWRARLPSTGDHIAPAPHEFEFSVFGPGVGECIVLHLGFGDWAIIDSCRDREAGTAAPLAYLRALGVDPATAVRLVVLTHWHDDHVAGAAEVFKHCTSARLVCSAALRTPEFLQIVAAGTRTMSRAAGTAEFGSILQLLRERAPSGARAASIGPDWTIENQLVWSRSSRPGDPGAELYSLSPSPAAVSLAIREFGQLLPRADNSPKKNLVRQQPNDASVVLWARIGGNRFLLGADLEHSSNPLTGWNAIVGSSRRPTGAAEVLKVAHHGSATAEHPGIWSTLLTPDPLAIVTPYRRSGLPSDTDIARLLGKTRKVYLTAPTRLPEPPRRDAVVERMARVVARDRRAIEGPIGHVCVRAPLGHSSLANASVKLRGKAAQVQ